MRIDYFKINGFGKLRNKEIELKKGINVIYGENEAGKSSMLKFMIGMLYGVSKNKNGKEISDFDKYKPWKTEEYSGKMEYTLDNKEIYEVYREFKKKNPIIYDENMQDISKNFTIDKNKGIDFFVEQTGIDEETFLNTAITEQEGIRLSKSSQNSIVQKISNLISSGDDNISFKKSLEKINKKQNEEVGTDRTSQRPLNVVNNRIRVLESNKQSLEVYKNNFYDNSLQKEQLYMEQKDEETKKEFLKEVKNRLDSNRLKNAEINFNINLEEDYDKKINELNEKVFNHMIKLDEVKENLMPYYIALALCIVFCIILFLIDRVTKIKYLFILPILILIGVILWKKYNSNNQSKYSKMRMQIQKEKTLQEIEILKENKEKQQKIANEKKEKLEEEIGRDNDYLINKYIDRLDLGYMEKQLDKNYDAILREIENKENRINSIKFKIHTMENESKNINNKIESLVEIEEELTELEQEREELISLNCSYQIAKECLENAYKQVRENISPKFIENLCDIVSKVSNNRYKKVLFNDNDGLIVEVENGKYIPALRLSIGTIDQMYISLRLSALTEISNETMPIILDEAFAYFDNDRLANMLRYLSTNFPNNQIIIFTCSNREKEMLNQLEIRYHLIELEK